MSSAKYLSFFATLRGRLLVLVCLATLPATLFTFCVANAERDATLRRSESDAKYVLNIASRQHINQINSARTLLRGLANKADRQSQALLHDKHYLAALLSGYPQLANIAFVETEGDVVSSAFPMDGPINMLHYEAIQDALHSVKPESGVYVIGPIVKRPLLHLAQAVRAQDGKPIGVVFVALDLDYMNRLLHEVELPAGYELHVLDRHGHVLASSNPHRTSLDEQETVKTGMEGLPGLQIATSIPYGRIRDSANREFIRISLVLSLLTLATVTSVVLLEEVALLRYLRMLARAARRFGEGDFSVRLKMPKHYGELERMAHAFNSMAATLQQRHQDLLQAHEQLNSLTKHLQIARESERMHIARELHDEVGQVLTSIKMDLSRLPRNDVVTDIRYKLDELVAFIRRIASSLRPSVLDAMGLVKALELLARQTERNTNLIINVDTIVDEPLDWLTSTTIYRIVQESLTNVVRHANASEVNVSVNQSSDHILVRVSDDGIGIDGNEERSDSLGIIGMRERAKMLSGKFALASTATGTTVEVVLPLVSKQNEDAEHAYSSS